MKKLRILFLFFISVLIINTQNANATDNYIPIRVGISNTNFQTYLFDSVEFLNANNLMVIDAETGYCAPVNELSQVIKITSENNLFRIYIDNTLVAQNLTGPITVRTLKDNNFISISGLKRKRKQASYRGIFELTRSTKDSSKFAIVNVLSLKNYLRGVVPNEMPVRFGLEALKAQTVAARNYAVTPRVKAYKEFDVCDSVACQVYFGANTEDKLSDRAVEETNGIIALDKEDNPILALYSSTAGGYTENYEYAFSDPKTRTFPSKPLHYLTAIPDNSEFDTLDTDEKADNFYNSKPEAFDDQSPYYRWSKDWTKTELENVLSKTMIAQSKTGFITPVLTNSTDFGSLKSIKVLQRGASGKVIKLQIETDKNTFIVQKELVIRRCFQKNGISLPSANFVINYVDSITPVYKFAGGGFGHGVGLSQWGAGKMASLGYTFDEILLHYYQGIRLATIPIKVYPNRKVNDRIFYSEYENAEVVVKNSGHYNKLIIYINNKELTVKLKDELTKVDISRYAEKGENKISYLLPDNDNHNSYVEIHIVVKE
jgi:stage II sporulation protein D